MAISKATDDLIKDFSKVIGTLIVMLGLTCIRAWLLSICVGLFFPGFALGFWNWVLVVITFRLLIGFRAES